MSRHAPVLGVILQGVYCIILVGPVTTRLHLADASDRVVFLSRVSEMLEQRDDGNFEAAISEVNPQFGTPWLPFLTRYLHIISVANTQSPFPTNTLPSYLSNTPSP